MNIKFDHINLTVKDIEESRAWYKNVFGFELLEEGIQHQDEKWAIVGKEDSMLCMYEDKNLKSAQEAGDGPFHRIYHFGLRISDKKFWEDKVKELGLKLQYGGVYKYPHSLSWYILDPSGHEIEVSFTEGKPLTF